MVGTANAARFGVHGMLAAVAAVAVMAAGAATASPPVPYLVADVGQGFGTTQGSEPEAYRELGERTLFFTDARYRPAHLGVTDGTPEGTRLLATLCDDLECLKPSWLWVGAGRALFTLDSFSGSSLPSLWGTDGTEAGTALLVPAAARHFANTPSLIVLGAFRGSDAALLQVRERDGTTAVWRSDATLDGTVRLAVVAGSESADVVVPAAPVGDRLVFVLPSAEHGREPWVTDGTPAGTGLLVDLSPGEEGSDPSDLTAAGGRVLFVADDGVHRRQLWSTDGTAAGTVRLTDSRHPPSVRAAAGGRAFVAVDSSDLWVTDGTPQGTSRLLAGFRILYDPFVVLGDRVFFTFADVEGDYDPQLFVSDGTAAGTRRLTDLVHGQHVAFPAFSFDLGADRPPFLVSGDRVFFRAWEPAFGTELWVSDGSAAGTHRVADLCAGECDTQIPEVSAVPHGLAFLVESHVIGEPQYRLWISDDLGGGPRELAESQHAIELGPWIADRLFFSTQVDAQPDPGVWATDGTVAGERRVAGFRAYGDWGTLHGAVGERALFTAPVSGRAEGPWVSDGTAEGTRSLGPLRPDHGGSSNPSGLLAHQGRLYFITSRRLWRSDGTAAGTERLVESVSAVHSAAGQLFIGGLAEPLRRLDAAGSGALAVLPGYTLVNEGIGEIGGRAVFFAYGAQSSGGLWITDGPAGSTHLLRAGLLPAQSSTGVQNLLRPTFVPVTAAGTPSLLFVASGDGGDERLWLTDGTPEGTHALEVDGFPQGGYFSLLVGLEPFAGGALIAVRSVQHEVWFSDGTAAGTRLLVQSRSPVRPYFTEVGGSAYFSTAEGELWRSDGTPQGTFVLVAPDDAGWLAEPTDLVAFQGRLVFTATDAELGRELWVSDGTPGGTRPFADLRPGPGGSAPRGVTVVGDLLYFSADDTIHGRELWVSDGTVGGSRMVGDVVPGPLSSDPMEMTAVGDLLFWSADDQVHGRELWALPGAADVAPCAADDDTLCLGTDGRFGVSVEWHDQHNGTSGVGHAVPVEGSAKSGTFWFFRPENVELLVKVLDGVPVNGFHWVFWGALSDVEYTITVTDPKRGATRRYHNPAGRICGGADTVAFAGLGTGAASSGEEGTAAAAAAAEPLLLAGGRFRVEVTWHNQRTGATGDGLARPVTDNTGFVSFFDSANVELVVKVLDGRPVNGRWWVFYGGLTDVEYTLRVVDTESSTQRTYHNPPGRICGGADTAAF